MGRFKELRNILIEKSKETIDLYRGLEGEYDYDYDLNSTDSPSNYSTWTNNKDLARQYAGESGYVYKITIPLNLIGYDYIDQDGERPLLFKNEKSCGLNGVCGDEYLIYHDHEEFGNYKITLDVTDESILKEGMEKIIMIYDVEKKTKSYRSKNNQPYFIAKDLMNNTIKFINKSPRKLAIYMENPSPRWMRDGVLQEYGKRWRFTGYQNFEGKVPNYID